MTPKLPHEHGFVSSTLSQKTSRQNNIKLRTPKWGKCFANDAVRRATKYSLLVHQAQVLQPVSIYIESIRTTNFSNIDFFHLRCVPARTAGIIFKNEVEYKPCLVEATTSTVGNHTSKQATLHNMLGVVGELMWDKTEWVRALAHPPAAANVRL